MSKPPRARYRTTNWKSYNAALAQRGSLQVWFDPRMQWLSAPTGMVASLLEMAGLDWPAPDFSTLSRR